MKSGILNKGNGGNWENSGKIKNQGFTNLGEKEEIYNFTN